MTKKLNGFAIRELQITHMILFIKHDTKLIIQHNIFFNLVINKF